MMNFWTNEDIDAILVQLNAQGFPFKGYEFSRLGEGLSLLGMGSSANVYNAYKKEKRDKEYAIKVIGFGNIHGDLESFLNSIEAQKNIGSFNNIVTIYDSIQLKVWIEGEHDVIRVEQVNLTKECRADGTEGDYILLQFILMEKITPVFVKKRFGYTLNPHKLDKYDEKEILKLAYDIGMAIEHTHKRKLIHRDIKLENIFYEQKTKSYKLGDFGIAKTVKDGMASTVAFTKGYGAPEVVGTIDDKYDFTADIYSFGMTLYVLMNNIRFPGSESYHSNVHQYMHGYNPPRPENGSDELAQIVLKMISFNPDDRYQSMGEVLAEFDRLIYGKRLKYQIEHRKLLLVLGGVLAIVGSVVWKLSFCGNLMLNFSVLDYIFCGLCLLKSILALSKIDVWHVNLAVLGCGIYLLVSSGFLWWKLLLLLILVLFSNVAIGVLGCGAVAANITYCIMSFQSLDVSDFYDYRWLAVLMLSLSCVLLFAYSVISERDYAITRMYFGKNLLWIISAMYYGVLFLIDRDYILNSGKVFILLVRVIGKSSMDWMMSWKPGLVGICGFTFCVMWMLRDYAASHVEKKQK